MWSTLRGRGKRTSDGGTPGLTSNPLASSPATKKPPVPTRGALKDKGGSQESPRAEGTIRAHPSFHDAEVGQDGQDSANNVKVLIRLRPLNEREKNLRGDASNLQQVGSSGLHLAVEDRDYSFKFDEVLGIDGTQEELFKLAGQPMVSNVMQGYNACCFAYGQTGAGKTHTMQGELGSDTSGSPHEFRGLAPRVFQQVFQAIENKEGDAAGAQLQYTCRCSFLQIYNEQISDLLHPAEKPLALRYDSESGAYVENLTEHVVVNVEDAMALMKRGAANRCVGETKMNRASSRSHSVFSMKVQCRTTMENGISKLRYGTLHIVDLAGSERVKISGATGAALTEASEINVSLTTLGRVISKVVESQASTKQVGRHIPYRDSKLTFLLQDSLGGNAKTMLVANVSPSTACAHETLSTLQFAERAKCIRNRAKVNTDTQGDQRALQAEVERLQAELSSLQDGVTGPLRAERDGLKERLDEVSTSLRDATARLENVNDERDQLQFQLSRLDEKLIKKETDLSQLENELKTLKAKSEADIIAARSEAAQQLETVGMTHASELAEAAAVKEAMASKLQTERDTAIKNIAGEKDTEVSRVTAEAEERIQRLEDVSAAAVSELENRCERLESERAAALKQREAVETRLVGEMEEYLLMAATAADTAAEAARAASKEAEVAHAAELNAARETLLEEKIAALEAAESRVRKEETSLRETALAEAEAKHVASVEGMQTEATGKVASVQKELEASLQVHERERVAAQEAADIAEAEVLALRQKIADTEKAAAQQQAAAEEMCSLQQKTAADAAAVQQKLESEFLAQSDKVLELQKSLTEAREALDARGWDVAAAQRAIADRELAVEDARKQVATLEQQIVDLKAESHTSLQSTRSELTMALQAHTAAEARAAQAEALVGTKSESLTEMRSQITLLKGHISDLEDKLSTAQQALSTAAEERHTAERELHSSHADDLASAKAEAVSSTRIEAEAVRVRELTSVTDRAASTEKALREEHAREVERLRSDAKEVSEALEKEVAGLRKQADSAADNLAELRTELSTAQREGMDASDAAAADIERLQDEMADLVESKDEEIERLRESLERAEAQEKSDVAKLQEQLLVQERESAAMRAQMCDALAAHAEEAATAAAEASAARAKWAGEAAQLCTERDCQRRDFEEAVATYNQKMQDLTADYEAELQAAKDAAANAADSSETEKSAATAARTAATASAERETLLKENLQDAEGRCVAASSELGACQRQVQELEEKVTALSQDLAEQRSAVHSAEQTAGAAAQERISALQAQIDDTQKERDQVQTDVQSLQHQLHDQNQRYRESAVESVTKIQALERHITDLEDALGRSEALRADLQADLDNKDSMYEEASRSNQMFAHLLDNIQEQICGAGSRPGSAASAQGGSSTAEAMIGAVRQSLDAAGLGKSMQQRARTPQRPGKLSAAALRPSSLRGESPTHNEYSRRERGLGKPCFTMDMGPGIAQNNSSGSLQAFGGKETGPLSYHGVSAPNSGLSTEENASPNASMKGFSRPWDNTV